MKWVQVILLGVTFVLATLSARIFVIPPEILAPVWPAAGVLMFGLLRIGRSYTIPAVFAAFVASVIGNRLTGVGLAPSLMFSAVNCVAGVVGAAMLRHRVPSGRFQTLNDLLVLMVYGAGLANAVGATFGAAVVSSFQLGSFPQAWIVWWLSNSLGILIVVPLASEWRHPKKLAREHWWRLLAETLAISAMMAALIFTAFGGESPVANFVTPFTVFPLLVWVAIRFGVMGAATASFVLSLLVLFAAGHGLSQLTSSYGSLFRRMIELQMFMNIAVVSALIPAAAFSDRERAERQIKKLNEDLVRDIAERNRAAEELSRNRLLLAEAEELSHTGAWQWDIVTNQWVFSDQWLALHGCKRRSLTPEQLLSLAHPDDRPAIQSAFDDVRRGLRPYELEHRIVRPDNGETRVVRARGQFVCDTGGRVVRAYGFAQDITEQKRAQEALERSEQRYRSFVEASAQVIWRTDPIGQVDVEIPAWNRFTGQTPEEARGWGWMQAIAPEHRQRVSEAWRVAAQSKTRYEVEYLLRRHDGAQRHVHARGVPVFESDGSIREWIGTCIDVTEQRQAEAALRASEEHLKKVVENLSEGLIVVDPHGAALHWNTEALRMHGFEDQQDELAFLYKVRDLYDVHSLDGVPVPIEQWPVTRLLRGEELRDYEVMVRRKDIDWQRIFSYRGTVVRNSLGEPIMGLLTIRDVTNMKHAEQTLIRTEKLATVGRMAATIAHEINNPLESVMNAVYLASSDPGISDESRAHLDLAEQELERAAHIARQTLGFYKETGAPRPVALTPLVRGVLDLHASKLKTKRVDVQERFTPDLAIMAVSGEIRQVISNLVSNAVDAIERAGRLHVRTSPYRAGEMVRITVADTGSGIEARHRRNIFEPFFTTKVAIGTGLGLWVSKQIVEKHGGSIRVRSRTGRGTVFSVYLPATGDHSSPTRQMEASA